MKQQRTLRASLAAHAVFPTDLDTFDSDRAVEAGGPARRGILVRVSPAMRRELKLLAAHLETSVQEMMLQAINELLVRHGRPPIV
jgi:hypothetical protein